MNKVILIGRLTKDPELKGSNENKVCVFTLAVNRNFTNQNGEREADFIQIKTFRKIAENCINFLHKGSLVSVIGSIRTGSYQKDGVTIFTTNIIADEVRFLEGKKTNTSHNNTEQNYNDDHLLANATELEDSEWPF